MSYSGESKAYRLFNPKIKELVISRDVFDEDITWKFELNDNEGISKIYVECEQKKRRNNPTQGESSQELKFSHPHHDTNQDQETWPVIPNDVDSDTPPKKVRSF